MAFVEIPNPPGFRNRWGAYCEKCGGWCPPREGTVIRTEDGNVVEHMDCEKKADDTRPYRNRKHDVSCLGFGFGLPFEGINGDDLREGDVDDDSCEPPTFAPLLSRLLIYRHSTAKRVAEDIARLTLPGHGPNLWRRHRAELSRAPTPVRELAWRALCERIESMQRMGHPGGWMKREIARLDADRKPVVPEDDQEDGRSYDQDLREFQARQSTHVERDPDDDDWMVDADMLYGSDD